MKCPDDRDNASRTIITGEGGKTPSRFKHVIAIEDEDPLEVRFPNGDTMPAQDLVDEYPWRRLCPEELEELNGFRRGWTRVSVNGNGPIRDTRRAFLMCNALVVGLVEQIGRELMTEWLALDSPTS